MFTCGLKLRHGTRYNSETLEVPHSKENISQVLDMTVNDAVNSSNIFRKAIPDHHDGTGYVTLGQILATTLSEKSAYEVSELHKRRQVTLLYSDDDDRGLHSRTRSRLLVLLSSLRRPFGNTVRH